MAPVRAVRARRRHRERLLEDSRPDFEARIRRELARELHDRVAQRLTVMLVGLEFFRREQFGRHGVLDTIAELERSTVAVINELRDLLFELRDEPGGEEDVAETLRGLLNDIGQRSGSETELRVAKEWPQRLPAADAAQVTRIVQEAARNAWMHGLAARLTVWLECIDEERLIVTIADDGLGIPEAGGVPNGGLGILGMNERALLLGGELTIQPSPAGGTIVRLVFPARIRRKSS